MKGDRPDAVLVAPVTAAVIARGGKLEGDEYRVRCVQPEKHQNGDARPSLRWNPKRAVYHCDSCGLGGGAVDLARALGVELRGRRRRVAPPSLGAFAGERCLSLDVLRDFGVRPTVERGRPALRYPTALGVDRLKLLDGKKPKYVWVEKGKGHAHWYGLEPAVGLLRAGAATLYLVNGEPSVWACAGHGVAAVALCGERARISPTLLEELRKALAGLGEVAIRVVYDVDAAGGDGARAAVAALRAPGFGNVEALDLAGELPDVPGADVDDLQRKVGEELGSTLARLPALASETAAGSGTTSSPPPSPAAATGASVAAKLIALSDDLECFHDVDGNPYVSLVIDGHRETHRLGSSALRAYLSRRCYQAHGRVPAGDAWSEVLGVLEGRARWEGPEHLVAVRLGEHAGAIYLDLGDSTWRVVEVKGAGWRVSDASPVRFLRPSGLRALPEPAHGGSVDELRPFLNVGTDDDWRLLVAWLLTALRPTGPYPVLALHGEQGAAKSTAARILRSLVDPAKASLRAGPRDARDLAIAAGNTWVLALDNLSRIPPWLSDALCRLATGGGYATRALYTDDEELLVDVQRPVVFTGIEELATRGDLADRTVGVVMPAISETARRTEEELWAAVERARPHVLGALLDAVATGVRRLDAVRLERLPRMADAARWMAACEPACGWPAGSILGAYDRNRREAAASTVEASAVGMAVVELMADRNRWEGTARALLEVLGARMPEAITRDRHRWPQGPKGLSGALERLAPALRAAGVTFTRLPRQARSRLLLLERTEDATVTNVTSVTGGGFTGSGNDDRAERPPHPSSESSLEESNSGAASDGCDDGDGAAGPSDRVLHGPRPVDPWAPERPARPCPLCGADEWWRQASGAWLCGVCRPPPSAYQGGAGHGR